MQMSGPTDMAAGGATEWPLRANALRVLLVGSLLAIAASPSPSVAKVQFEDGFESASSTRDLFPSSGKRWTYQQLTHSTNVIQVTSERARSGHQSLKLVAVASTRPVSKASIERGSLVLPEGKTMTMSAWFYIPSGQSLDQIFLMDLECQSCWPDKGKHPNTSPGLRVMLTGANGVPVVERGKIGYRNGTFRQTAGREVPLPRDRWFKFDWVVFLSPDENGRTELVIDGQRVLTATGITLPNRALFRGLGIELKPNLLYDRVQFGITANPAAGTVTMFVDDVTVSVDD